VDRHSKSLGKEAPAADEKVLKEKVEGDGEASGEHTEDVTPGMKNIKEELDRILHEQDGRPRGDNGEVCEECT